MPPVPPSSLRSPWPRKPGRSMRRPGDGRTRAVVPPYLRPPSLRKPSRYFNRRAGVGVAHKLPIRKWYTATVCPARVYCGAAIDMSSRPLQAIFLLEPLQTRCRNPHTGVCFPSLPHINWSFSYSREGSGAPIPSWGRRLYHLCLSGIRMLPPLHFKWVAAGLIRWRRNN